MTEPKQKPINTAIIKAKDYWQMLGPGLTTGAADDDPSGIVSYTQAGASYGYNFLWTSVLTFPLMAIVQEMCARIGIVTGRGLAGSIRRHYSKRVLYIIAALLFVANTFNIGADLVIMGQVGHLLFTKFAAEIYIFLFAIISLLLQIFTSYKDYAKYLKWLALLLASYIISTFLIHVDWADVVRKSIVPHISWDRDFLFILTAIVGTTISPYLFFWQTSQEVEEQILAGKKTIKSRMAVTTKEDIKKMRVDVWSGMLVSNVVMFFIIVASAATLFASGHTGATDALTAAQALKPLAGNAAFFLFSLGIIGTGMLAIPVLAGSSSYAITESLGLREGLYRKFKQAHAFYGVIIISVLCGLIISAFKLDPIQTLLYSAVINGIISPFVLVLIVLLSQNKKIMGEWANRRSTNIVGWAIVVLLCLVSVAGLISVL